MSTIADYVIGVRERIFRAAEKNGRSGEEIRLVAVTKRQPVEAVREALAAGVRELGENYVQEAEQKWAELGRVLATRHLIGHLQRNKAGKAAALFDMVQTVDSLELARALGRRAGDLGRELDALIEVNISGEATKHGVAPEAAGDLAGQVAEVPGLRLRGLMGMGPAEADEAATRRSFQRLRALFEQLPPEHRQVLSMGMTGDFELAIAEGSTMVRIGTGLFGGRRS
ncbi:MAG TPA: YggS family pyridoxal phosphate-dependent enzyme [Armatimonadota bacterium]|nr:YggS family pyridoxal phosphate-dependent enzyme [Armatimonadota bacterium]